MPRIVWVVEAGDGATIADVAERAGVGDRPLRIYLNGRRAERDDPVSLGDRVELWPAASAGTEDSVHVLTQRDGIVIAHKPAGMPAEPTPRGRESVVVELAALLGGARVHAASRLDVGVSGAMLCTLGRDAARRVVKLREQGAIERRYLAIVAGVPGEREGVWDRPLSKGKDRRGRARAFVGGQRSKPATTRWVCRGVAADAFALLELTLETGRMHQIRAHASHARLPVLGDRQYGDGPHVTDPTGRVHALDRLALHAWRCALPGMTAQVLPPKAMVALWRALGGDDDAWARQPSIGS